MNTRTSRHILTLGLVLGALSTLNIITIMWGFGWIVLFSSLIGALDFNGVFGNRIMKNECKTIRILLILNLANTLIILFVVISISIMRINLPLGLDVMVTFPIVSLVLGILSVAILIYSYRKCVGDKTTMESV